MSFHAWEYPYQSRNFDSGSVKTTSSVAFISQRNELGSVLLYHYNYDELR